MDEQSRKIIGSLREYFADAAKTTSKKSSFIVVRGVEAVEKARIWQNRHFAEVSSYEKPSFYGKLRSGSSMSLTCFGSGEDDVVMLWSFNDELWAREAQSSIAETLPTAVSQVLKIKDFS